MPWRPCERAAVLPHGPWPGEYIAVTPDIANTPSGPWFDHDRAHAVGRALSGILRHGHCLNMRGDLQVVRPDGFLAVSHVMQALRQKECGNVSLAELEAAVDMNDKCRFQLLFAPGSSHGPIIAVRASYAHSLNDVDDEFLHMPA